MSAVEEKDRSVTDSENEERPSKKSVREAFLACPRCSYFLSGYRLIHNDFQEILEASTKEWLVLVADHKTRLLIYESYGNRINQNTEYYEGICPDCRRRFVYDGENGDNPQFQIRIKPG